MRTKRKNKKNITPAKTEIGLITVIMLCDSPGYRMRSYGPTSLVTIGRKKLIDLQIEAIKKAFDKFEIILCVGFDSEKVCKYIRQKYKNINIRTVENQLFGSSNSCESVRLSIDNTMNHKLIICNGDLLINKKTLSLINVNQSCALIEKGCSENLDIGININELSEAQHFSFGAYRTWSEILYLDGHEIIENFRKILSRNDSKKKFIFEALNELIKSKYIIRCIENKFTLEKINNIKTYHNIRDNHEIFDI